jgi:hypothetical protein
LASSRLLIGPGPLGKLARYGEVIEEYQDDSPYPGILVFGQTFGGNPIHSVWAYNEMKRWAVLIKSTDLTQIYGSAAK